MFNKNCEKVPEAMRDLPKERTAWLREEIDKDTVQITFIGHRAEAGCECERAGGSR